jgi:hypothetical protein
MIPHFFLYSCSVIFIQYDGHVYVKVAVKMMFNLERQLFHCAFLKSIKSLDMGLNTEMIDTEQTLYSFEKRSKNACSIMKPMQIITKDLHA